MKDLMKMLCALTVVLGALYLAFRLAECLCGKCKRSYMTVE